jgi:DNA-binding IclR family transcriptional regulator
MSQSARKALDLLAAVAAADEPKGLVQIAAATELDKSTAARLLALLEEMTLLHRDPRTKRYDIGPGLVALASGVLRRVDVRHATRTALEHLRDQTEETVSLHIRAGTQRVCIYGVESRHLVRRVIRVGEALPLTTGSSGRVILSMLDPEEARAVMVANGKPESEIADELAELAEVRAAGYVIANSIRVPGVGAACIPLRFGEQLAALAVSGPSSRWHAKRARSFLAQLRTTTEQLEAILGDDIQDFWRGASLVEELAAP